MASFSPSIFKFITVIPDDGGGQSGGWQEAKAALFVLPSAMVKPEFREPPPLPKFRPRRRDTSFDFSPDEQPYAACIAQDIEATWGYERMPPKVGRVIVPDVATDLHVLGEATLYDCLFSDGW